jgi:hypothetical protein
VRFDQAERRYIDAHFPRSVRFRRVCLPSLLARNVSELTMVRYDALQLRYSVGFHEEESAMRRGASAVPLLVVLLLGAFVLGGTRAAALLETTPKILRIDWGGVPLRPASPSLTWPRVGRAATSSPDRQAVAR